MTYPMEIAKVSLRHRGGTKEYFLTLIVNAVGKAIVIRRWGATGKLGQTKVLQFDTGHEAEKDFERELNSRQSGAKGYAVRENRTIQVANAGELAQAIGRTVTPKIGSSNLLHIDPNYDVTGVRDPVQTMTEDGQYLGEQKNHVDMNSDAFKAVEETARLKELDAMRSNPMFGRF